MTQSLLSLMDRWAEPPITPDRRLISGLQQSGCEVGRNLRVETLWAGSNSEEIRRRAAELVALAPDVILASVVLGLPALCPVDAG